MTAQEWSAAIATLALLVSVAPYAWRYLRHAHLDVDAYTMIALGVQTGSGLPRVEMHVDLRNSGGREARVKRLALRLNRDKGADEFELQAMGYFADFNDRSPVLMTPVAVKARETWSHTVRFMNFMTRNDDRLKRELRSWIVADIDQKIRALPKEAPQDARPVPADEQYWRPLVEFFNARFRWRPGEYVLTLIVETDSKRTSTEKSYRFAVFESDERDLLAQTDDFKFGWTIDFDPPPERRRTVVFVPLSAA